MGLPLRHIRDIQQLYGVAPGSSEIDFDMIRPTAILDYIKTSGLNVSNTEGWLFQVLQGLASLETK